MAPIDVNEMARFVRTIIELEASEATATLSFVEHEGRTHISEFIIKAVSRKKTAPHLKLVEND